MHYRFENFALDTDLQQLTCDGEPLEIDSKAVDLLVLLLENRDRIVPKQEILDTLWPDVTVGANSISQTVYLLRRALRDDSRSPRLIHTLRGRGLRFAGDVEFGRRVVARADFVGREAELRTLESAYARACGGHLQALVLEGEAGVGKTRLAAEFASRLSDSGSGSVRLGRCSEAAGAPAYWPWIQVLREEVSGAPASLVHRLGRAAPHLGEFIPELGGWDHPSPSGASTRFALHDAICELLSFASEPRLIVLDDLHLADRASVSLLEFLVAQLSTAPLMILGTSRLADGGESRSRGWNTQWMHLSGLSLKEAELLLATRTGPIEGEVLQGLHIATDGNPFMLEQLAGRLDVNRLIDDSAALHEEVGIQIASSAAEVSPQCLAVLQAAAVCGVRFQPAEVGLAAGCSGAECARLLSDPELRSFVRSDSAGEYEFVHALVRNAIYTQMNPAEAARIHSRLATSLADSEPRGHRQLLRVFWHAAEAPASLGIGKTCSIGASAINSAIDARAFEDARSAARRLVQVVRSHRVGNEVTAESLYWLGAAEALCGSRDLGRASLWEAAELARVERDAALLARIALAAAPGFFAIETGVVDDRLVAVLRDASAAVGNGNPLLRATLGARLAMALYWARDQAQISELVTEAEQLAAGGPKAVTAFVMLAKCMATWTPGEIGSRQEVALAALQDARSAGDVELEMIALVFLITGCLEVGDAVAFRTYRAQLDTKLEAGGVPSASWYGVLYRGGEALNEGRLAQAQEAISSLQESRMRLDDANLEASILLQLALLLWWKCEAGPVSGQLGEVVHRWPHLVAWRMARALVLLDCDRSKEAQAEFGALAAAGFDNLPLDTVHVAGLAVAARVGERVGSTTQNQALYRALAPYRGQVAVVGYGVITLGSVDAALGRLSGAIGDLERAAAHYDEAIELETRAGCTAWLASSQAAFAGLLSRTGRSRDIAKQRELADRALGLARDLELPRVSLELRGQV